MKVNHEHPFDSLDRLFHEPNRLSIVSALSGAEGGLPFTELREACRLTDGNLNRHLKALEEAGVVRLRKAFVDGKPRTTVLLSRAGLDRFEQYLEVLGSVLRQARGTLKGEAPGEAPLALGAVART
jgi:DNA-binding transcriptional ArsR family regulator